MKDSKPSKYTRNKRLQLSLKHLDESREDLRRATSRLKDRNNQLEKVVK